MTRILVVEDEPGLRKALGINLRARGYEVALAGDGRSALTAASQHPPDAVILDLGLPDMDGTEVIEGLRGWSQAPIVVLSARSEEPDKVTALDTGADDYVTKPFGMDELLARLRAALRRAAGSEELPAIATESFTVDLAAKQVLANDGDRIRLTPTEWNVLEVLVRNEGKLVSQRQLLQEVWGPRYETETNYLRVYLAQLRRKLEPDPSHPRLPDHRARRGISVRREVADGSVAAPGYAPASGTGMPRRWTSLTPGGRSAGAILRPAREAARSRSGRRRRARSRCQARSLDDPWVVARDESGPRYVSHYHAQSPPPGGLSAFSKASATASDTVAVSSTRRSALS